MARDAAVVARWGSSIPGREAKSLEVFMEFLAFWGGHAEAGRCSSPEPFFAVNGSGGMAVIRGKSDALSEIVFSEESEKIVGKGTMIVNDLRVDLYFAGDEIMRGTQIFVEAGTELGFM
jgi:hypothetical protein